MTTSPPSETRDDPPPGMIFSWSGMPFRIAKSCQHTPIIAAVLSRDAYTP